MVELPSVEYSRRRYRSWMLDVISGMLTAGLAFLTIPRLLRDPGAGSPSVLGAVLEGGPGDDTLDCRSAFGDVTIRGNDGLDKLWGGYGNDILVGGTGGDWMFGMDGDDFFDAVDQAEGDYVNGGAHDKGDAAWVDWSGGSVDPADLERFVTGVEFITLYYYEPVG